MVVKCPTGIAGISCIPRQEGLINWTDPADYLTYTINMGLAFIFSSNTLLSLSAIKIYSLLLILLKYYICNVFWEISQGLTVTSLFGGQQDYFRGKTGSCRG